MTTITKIEARDFVYPFFGYTTSEKGEVRLIDALDRNRLRQVSRIMKKYFIAGMELKNIGSNENNNYIITYSRDKRDNGQWLSFYERVKGFGLGENDIQNRFVIDRYGNTELVKYTIYDNKNDRYLYIVSETNGVKNDYWKLNENIVLK